MTGVLILALKKDTYAAAAANLALSIKHFNPNISVTLITDNNHLNVFLVHDFANFNFIKEMNICDYTDKDGFCPAKAKLNAYKYTPYDNTLYIDADSIVLQDLQPLFNKLKGNEFKTNNITGYTQWINEAAFNNFFGVPYGLTINSSWYYWENPRVFIQANEFYSKGLDKSLMFQKWGNTLADEIFFNASITKLGINPVVDFPVMFFGNNIDERSLTEIEETYFAFTLYGDRRTVRDVYIDFYDKLLFRMYRSKGYEHNYKAHGLLTNKHVNQK